MALRGSCFLRVSIVAVSAGLSGCPTHPLDNNKRNVSSVSKGEHIISLLKIILLKSLMVFGMVDG